MSVGEKVCWQRGKDWQVGTIADIAVDSNTPTRGEHTREGVLDLIDREGFTLIDPWPSGKPVLVATSLLRPYPFEEIAQP